MNIPSGALSIIGDKSISHRSLILCSLAEGVSRLSNVLISGDTNATIEILRSLGVEIIQEGENKLKIFGVGLLGLKKPLKSLHAASSGTTARLFIGLLSKQKFSSILEGSEQLTSRPMARIVEPLKENGALISDTKGKLPVSIYPSEFKFEKITTSTPSAQVKSGFLLAALYHNEPTTITENTPTRDHTERMLDFMGVNVVRLGNNITLQPTKQLKPIEYDIPGDPSSASFLVALGILSRGEIVLKNVLINERRIGFFKILKKMNANIQFQNIEVINNEPVGDIYIKKSDLIGVEIDKSQVSDMVDEFPIFTLLATQAKGITLVKGAKELRYKESDRIMAMEKFIHTLGGKVETFSDGFKLQGIQKLNKGIIKTYNDHRISMTAVIASLSLNNGIKADDINCISDSYPSFFSDLNKLGVNYDS